MTKKKTSITSTMICIDRYTNLYIYHLFTTQERTFCCLIVVLLKTQHTKKKFNFHVAEKALHII